MAPSAAHEVVVGRRQRDDEAVQFLGHGDLATEPGGLAHVESEIEHVLLLLADGAELVDPRRVGVDVAGRARHRALAGTLQIEAVEVRDFDHGQTLGGLDLMARPPRVDEGHLQHGAGQTEKLSPQPQTFLALGLLNTKPDCSLSSR
jgi:hypothetical protein